MKKPHLKVVKRILKYVKGSIDYGIQYHNNSKSKVARYCDVDYVGDHDTRRSTIDVYVFNMGYGAILWCSKGQLTMSLSSTVAISWCSKGQLTTNKYFFSLF